MSPASTRPGAGLQGTGNSGRGLVWQQCREKTSLFGEGQLQDGEMFALNWIHRRAQTHWAGAGSSFMREMGMVSDPEDVSSFLSCIAHFLINSNLMESRSTLRFVTHADPPQ